jgi:hypothetical protein
LLQNLRLASMKRCRQSQQQHHRAPCLRPKTSCDQYPRAQRWTRFNIAFDSNRNRFSGKQHIVIFLRRWMRFDFARTDPAWTENGSNSLAPAPGVHRHHATRVYFDAQQRLSHSYRSRLKITLRRCVESTEGVSRITRQRRPGR